MVAESMVIFGPIDQLGCLSACSSVAARIASRVQVRNGPPEAVRMMRLTSSRRTGAQRLEDRVVLGIDRQHASRPPPRRVRMNSAPAQTRHSLLASATVAPRSAAASVGFKSGRAADRSHHPVGRPLGRFDQRPPRRCAASMPVPASASLSSR